VLARHFKFAPFAPIVPVSARTREAIGGILPAALEVVGQRRIKMPPNELNRVLREAFLSHPPPSYKGRRLKLGYATQAGGEAPTVVLFVNDTGLLHFSYRRYLEHQIRNRFGLIGNPLKLVLREANAKGTSAPERRKARDAAPHPSPPPAGEGTPFKREGKTAGAARARGKAPHPRPPPAGEGTSRSRQGRR
jgi:hypothetical protein